MIIKIKVLNFSRENNRFYYYNERKTMFKEYISYTESNNQWLLRDQYAYLTPYLQQIKTPIDHTLINVKREDRFKILAEFEVSNSGEVCRFILKVYKYPSFFQQLRQLLKRTKAFREFRMTYLAGFNSVPVEVPVAFGEQKSLFIKESYLIIRKIEHSVTLNDYFRNNDCYAERRSVLREFGKLARTIHDSGVKQDDFSLNNFLMSEHDGHIKIILIDFERVSIQPESLQEKQSILYLAKLNRTKGLFCNTDRLRFLMSYTNGDYAYGKKLAKQIESMTILLQKKDSKKFVRQCVCKNRKFGVFSDTKFQGWHRKAYSQETIKTLLAATDRMDNAGMQIDQYQITRYAKMPPFHNAMDLWKHANALFALRINLPVPVGMFKRISPGRARDEFFIFQLPDNWESIDRYLTSNKNPDIVMRTIKVFIEEISPFGAVSQNLKAQDIILQTDKHHRQKCFLKDCSLFFVNKKTFQQNKSFNTKVFEQVLMGYDNQLQ
ncbi:MAG: hypothetical protein FJ264_13820 [Planctomycetes bacterium]|nr:hypothetical protein [Planctomycetota bacterium]